MKAAGSVDYNCFTLRCKSYEDRGERHSSGYDDVRYLIEGILRLKPEQFEPMENGGRYGYRKGVSFNGIEIYYDGNSLDMGANVSMSGTGCRTYAQFHPMEDLLGRIYDGVKDGEINPTRVDLAYDDFEGCLAPKRIIDIIREGQMRTRVKRRCRAIISIDGTDKDEGDTVYIGSEKSDKRTRIYDKAKEQGDYEGVWNRLEMVFRHDHARAVLEALVAGELPLGETMAGILSDQIAFIERDDVNISRCSLAAWWVEFLENVKRIRLMLKEKPVQTVERLAEYVDRTLSACVYVLSETFGDSFWQRIKERGKQKIRRRHLSMLNNHTLLSV
ncbi:MAG: replication initiation factor domain-containing protein [Oscillospiraceae bacterium]|jgi:phage replication initiation protein|nr:replication initiation factor domain-containing protein [Oscillospiraceae bacterium]